MPTVIRADLNQPAHAAAEIMLLDAYARDPMGGGKGLDERVRRRLCKELLRRDAAVVLAFVDDRPVGLINAFEAFSTFQCRPILNIHDVSVLPDFRGQGVGRAMLKEVEAIARERDCCKLTLEVLAGNAPARSLYEKAGFRGYELDPSFGSALFFEKTL